VGFSTEEDGKMKEDFFKKLKRLGLVDETIEDMVDEIDSLRSRLTAQKTLAAPLPDCDICHQHQTEPGAVKISAPRKIDGLEGMWCKKIHICVRCIKEEK